MDMVCAGLDFVFVYLDDILIASEAAIEHKEHLRILFDRLEEHNLKTVNFNRYYEDGLGTDYFLKRPFRRSSGH